MIEYKDTYTVSVWDHDEECWVPEFEHIKKWGLRRAIRELRERGYSSVSYLVERDWEPAGS
jgi:hypothetical protein